MTEQLEQDLKRNELVKNGEITQEQADKQAEQWEKVRLQVLEVLFFFGVCAMMDGFLPSLKSEAFPSIFVTIICDEDVV